MVTGREWTDHFSPPPPLHALINAVATRLYNNWYLAKDISTN